MPWFALKFLGLARWAWMLIAIAAITGLVVWFGLREKADDENNQAIGRSVERVENLEETLNRVETGNEIRENTVRDSNAAYAECLQSARTPENCVGLLSASEIDQLRADADR